MEVEGSLPCSQKPRTSPPDEPRPSRPQHSVLPVQAPFQRSPPTCTIHICILLAASFLLDCPPVIRMPSSSLHICYMSCLPNPPWFDLKFDKSTRYEMCHYAVSSNLLPLHATSLSVCSSEPILDMPYVWVIPLVSEAKLSTHTKDRQKYIFSVL
jgi:hypothetical protein